MAEFASRAPHLRADRARSRQLVKHAFLAAEDRDFYNHNGVNPGAMLRAAVTDLLRFGRGQRPIGASTITQQVVRHFLLDQRGVDLAQDQGDAARLPHRGPAQQGPHPRDLSQRDLSRRRRLRRRRRGRHLFPEAARPVDAGARSRFSRPCRRRPTTTTRCAMPPAAQARRDWVLAGMAEVGCDHARPRRRRRSPSRSASSLRPPEPPTDAERLFRRGGAARADRAGSARRPCTKAGSPSARAIRRTTRRWPNAPSTTGSSPMTGAMAGAARCTHLATRRRREVGAGRRSPIRRASPTWQLAAVTADRRRRRRHRAQRRRHAAASRSSELRWARRTLADQRLGAGAAARRRRAERGRHRLVEPLGTAPAAGQAQRQSAAARARRQPLYGAAPDPRCQRRRLSWWTRRPGGSMRWSAAGTFAAEPVQPRDPGEAAAGLGVQAVRLRDGDGKRVHPATASSTTRRSRLPQGPGLPPWKPANYEGTYGRPEHAARRADPFAQPGDGAARDDDRDAVDRQDRPELRRHGPDAALLLDGARRRRDDAAAADRGLRDDRQWRALAAAVGDRPVQDRDGQIVYQKGVGACAGLLCRRRPDATRRTPRALTRRPARRRRVDLVPNAEFAANARALQADQARPAGHARRRRPDHLDDAGRRAARHRHRRRRGRQAARRQDRHDQRFLRRLVCRLLARPGRRRCLSASTSRAPSAMTRPAAMSRRRSSAISWRPR